MPTSWSTPLDNYCERIDAGFWSEPVNAVTNAAFLFAAAYVLRLWRRNGARDWAGLWLIAVTTVIGIGSFLFHTFANRWSAMADVVPIAVFIYSYFLLALRRYLRLGILAAIVATVLFAAFNISFGSLWPSVFPGLRLSGSVGYIPAALALLVVGSLCHSINERLAGNALLLAGGIFIVSLFFRSIDDVVCADWPVGTHFLWHMLNALVLGVLMTAAISHFARSRHAHAES